jgi:hypothetical protein
MQNISTIFNKCQESCKLFSTTLTRTASIGTSAHRTRRMGPPPLAWPVVQHQLYSAKGPRRWNSAYPNGVILCNFHTPLCAKQSLNLPLIWRSPWCRPPTIGLSHSNDLRLNLLQATQWHGHGMLTSNSGKKSWLHDMIMSDLQHFWIILNMCEYLLNMFV